MTNSRALLTVFGLLAALAAVGTAAAAPKDHESVAAESGGALAEPLTEPAELEGGGAVAPRGAEEADAADAEAGAQAARTNREESPAGFEREEERATDPPEAAPAQAVEDPAYEELAGPVSEPGEAGLPSTGLPSTGLELAAMATIGLGLLMLGAALRPSRRTTGGR